MVDPLKTAEPSGPSESQRLTESTDLQTLLSAILGDAAETQTPGNRPAGATVAAQVSPEPSDPAETTIDSHAALATAPPRAPLSFGQRTKKRSDRSERSAHPPEPPPVPLTSAAPTAVARLTVARSDDAAYRLASPDPSVRSKPQPDAPSTPSRWRSSISLVAIAGAGLIALWFGTRPVPSEQAQPKPGGPTVDAAALSQATAFAVSRSAEAERATAETKATPPSLVGAFEPRASDLGTIDRSVDSIGRPGATSPETSAVRANQRAQVARNDRTSIPSLGVPRGTVGVASGGVARITPESADRLALVDVTPQLPDVTREPIVVSSPATPEPAVTGSEPGATTRESTLAADAAQPTPLPTPRAGVAAAAPIPMLLSRPAGLVSRAEPVTGTAASQIETGVVNVRVTIDATGRVTAARGTTGPMALRDLAEDAARRSRFEPALTAGVATSSDVMVTYTFTRPANDVRTRTR